MTGNVLGERFVVVSFGESHGRCVGAVVDGCPAGLPLGESDIQEMLDLRKPGTSRIHSSRREEDRVEILSGVFDGYTTGAPIAMIVKNKDRDSSRYREYVTKPRPGHADYTARMKYGGFNDWRGGGRFSGRITVSMVMAGAIAKKLLKHCLGVEVLAYTKEVNDVTAGKVSLNMVREQRYSNPARCPDAEAARRMIRVIEAASREGDSVGGVVNALVPNPPAGLGEPVFSSLESDLSKALFSIPAVKAVGFGSGTRAARMKGSEHNDPFIFKEGRVMTSTNNAGGILGGISNGMPIVLRVFFKPPASIKKPQKTVNLEESREDTIVVKGRHDPCVVPRAVPVVESVVAMVLADHAIRSGLIKPSLGDRSIETSKKLNPDKL